MYTISIVVHCPETNAEILPEETKLAELAIEALVSPVLLELFNSVIVETVTVQCVPDEQDNLPPDNT